MYRYYTALYSPSELYPHQITPGICQWCWCFILTSMASHVTCSALSITPLMYTHITHPSHHRLPKSPWVRLLPCMGLLRRLSRINTNISDIMLSPQRHITLAIALCASPITATTLSTSWSNYGVITTRHGRIIGAILIILSTAHQSPSHPHQYLIQNNKDKQTPHNHMLLNPTPLHGAHQPAWYTQSIQFMMHWHLENQKRECFYNPKCSFHWACVLIFPRIQQSQHS